LPDILAIKGGKPFAVEVTFTPPDIRKYEKNNPENEYADIIWIYKGLIEKPLPRRKKDKGIPIPKRWQE